jgi:hypothetical protein
MMSRCVQRVWHLAPAFGRLVLVLPALFILPVDKSWSINWEGHDDWFHDASPFEAFTKDVPPPIQKPWPTCAEREKERQNNIYNQVPIPGVNCHEKAV